MQQSYHNYTFEVSRSRCANGQSVAKLQTDEIPYTCFKILALRPPENRQFRQGKNLGFGDGRSWKKPRFRFRLPLQHYTCSIRHSPLSCDELAVVFNLDVTILE